jgi:SAM-dependent methyltransferase
MGLKFQRKKRRNLLASILYRASRFLFFLKAEDKFKLFLDLSWIFSHLAHEHSFKTNIKVNNRFNFLLKYIKNTDKILDMGCGQGRLVTEISRVTVDITGVDFDIKNLEIAKKSNQNNAIRFIYDDIVRYVATIDDNSFDVAILSHILEHLESPEDFLKILRNKVLRLYIEVPDFESTLLNLFRAELKRDLSYEDADHRYEFDRFEMKALLEKSNFEIFDADYRFGFIRIWARARS